jgi:hypothetical protein
MQLTVCGALVREVESPSRLMQRPRAAIRAGGLDLLQDVGAALRIDLVCRFSDKRVAMKARDFRIDRGLDVLNDGLDTDWVIRVEAGRE